MSQRALLTRIVRSFQSPVIRVYCRIRFLIIRQGFLNEIGQYLPESGRVLDLGCGFGLFSLYFAGLHPNRELEGYDRNPKRIAMARRAAEALQISNAQYVEGDVATMAISKQYDAAYAVDIMHHIPKDKVPDVLSGLYRALRPGGRLIVKDVDSRPLYKRWFTLWLDRAMVGLSEPIYYWPNEEMQELLREIGFQVYVHPMRDILPYPHILYLCQKPQEPRDPQQPE